MNTKMLLSKGLRALFILPLFPLPALAKDIQEATRDFGVTPHDHYDAVLEHVFLDITVIGIIFGLFTLYLMIRYRRKSADDVGKQPKLSVHAMLGWAIIPAAIFLADDMYLFALGWDLHDNYRKVPKNAYEVKVTGQLWSWSYEYPNGVTSENELVVPQGRPVLLRMTSMDVVHSHYMNKYRVTEDLMPGRTTYMWFLPDKLGESVVTCREYCGMMHSSMYGTVRVVTQSKFNAWLTEQQTAATDVGVQKLAAVETAATAANGKPAGEI
jgi:cytochrome c oxidase subunit 2